jgi:hypothetical protein
MKSPFFAAVMLLAALAPAAAATRDDVVQGIVRCGTLADDRQWLDCIYGAAQPMRAQLGLSPAPLAQQRLVPAQGYGTLPGYGGTPAAPTYAPMPVPAAPLPRAAYAPAPPPAPARRPEQGFFERMMGEKNVPDVKSRMASYSFDGQNLFTVTLANGQTWQQLASEDKHARWVRAAGRYIVTISPGSIGTLNLTVES